MSLIYCGMGKVPKNKLRRGNLEECLEQKQVRFYGIQGKPREIKKIKDEKKKRKKENKFYKKIDEKIKKTEQKDREKFKKMLNTDEKLKNLKSYEKTEFLKRNMLNRRHKLIYSRKRAMKKLELSPWQQFIKSIGGPKKGINKESQQYKNFLKTFEK